MKAVVCAGAYIEKNGKFLLVQEQSGKYNFPMGVVEIGESPRDACAREVAEETGLVVQTGKLRKVLLVRRQDFHLIKFLYDATVTGNVVREVREPRQRLVVEVVASVLDAGLRHLVEPERGARGDGAVVVPHHGRHRPLPDRGHALRRPGVVADHVARVAQRVDRREVLEHGLERGQVDEVLALVVGRPAAIDAVALLDALAPLLHGPDGRRRLVAVDAVGAVLPDPPVAVPPVSSL